MQRGIKRLKQKGQYLAIWHPYSLLLMEERTNTHIVTYDMASAWENMAGV